MTCIEKTDEAWLPQDTLPSEKQGPNHSFNNETIMCRTYHIKARKNTEHGSPFGFVGVF
jgi:hypothetical protein